MHEHLINKNIELILFEAEADDEPRHFSVL